MHLLQIKTALSMFVVSAGLILASLGSSITTAGAGMSAEDISMAWESVQGHNAMSVGVTWSPDDKYVANSYYDSVIVIWNSADGKLQKKLNVPSPSSMDQAYPEPILKPLDSKDSNNPFGSSNPPSDPNCDWPSDSDNSTYLPVRCVAWSPDGKYLAAGSDSTNITIFNTSSWEIDRIFAGHKGSVLTVDWSPDSRYLASGSGTDNIDPHNDPENIIKIWNMTSGKLEFELKGHKDSVMSLRWSPDGKQLASVADNKDMSVRIWDIEARNCSRVITGHTLGTLTVGWSPDGKLLASGSRDFTIRVWYVSNGTMKKVFRSNNCVRSVDFHPASELLAASGPAESMLQVWNLSSGNKREFTESDAARSTVFQSRWSHDGKMLSASSGKEHKCRLYSFSGTGGNQDNTDKIPPWLPGTILFFAISITVCLIGLYFGGKDMWRRW